MELKQALSIAIGYEHKVRDHYRRAADEVLDPRGRKVMETLAREEEGHVAYLESRLQEWRSTGKVSEEPVSTLLPTEDFIKAASKRVEKGPAATVALQAELELLKTALELERQTSAFYAELVAGLGAEHRPLFARFLEIEQGHLTIVQAEIDHLTGSGTWFDFMEFSLEG